MNEPGEPAPFDDAAVLELCRRRRPDDPRFKRPDYLDWLYRRNPEGAALHAEVERDGRMLAHVAAIPQRWRSGTQEHQVGLLVNFMATGDGRRLGYLPELVRRLRSAGAERDAPGAFAVTNATSTPVARRILKGRHLGPLPVAVGISRGRPPGVSSQPATPDAVAALASWTPPARGWHQVWHEPLLRWRVDRPGATYAVHRADDAAAITTTTTVAKVRFTVICKLLRLDDGAGLRPADDLIDAACRHHRTSAYVHAGIEAQFSVRGLQPPRRLLPSPLHLLYLPVADEPGPSFRDLASFAFLDFDAF